MLHEAEGCRVCSIIGYYGSEDAAPVLVSGLGRMEYRGYDSVGVATKSGSSIELKKGIGRVSEVNRASGLDKMPGKIGIGHTRWATHGSVTAENAHPHASNSGSIAIVHNGIIENFAGLKKELEAGGFKFASETDTEVIANLLQKNYSSSPEDAMIRTLAQLEGHYSFVAMLENGTLMAARFHEPLIIGVGSDSYYVASDVLGFVEKTSDAIYVENGSFVIIDSRGMRVYDFDGRPIRTAITRVSQEVAGASKGGYTHYTLKEIAEQPETLLRAGGAESAVAGAAEAIKGAESAYITGSGSSYNAALVAQHMTARYAGIRLEPVISSEFPHSPVAVSSGSVLVAVSQSGESADVLESVRAAKKAGAAVISLVNAAESSLARESDSVVLMECGREIGVAATKSFTSQLGAAYRMAGAMSGGALKTDMQKASAAMREIIADDGEITSLAKVLKDVSDIYVLGRGLHYPIAMEAALKLKELTYIHAEGIAGGELKHGPLALMDSSSYVIILSPSDSTYRDTQTSAREIKARGAKIIGISDRPSDVYDYWLKIPQVEPHAYPIIEILPVQMLAYHAALARGEDPDYPRNLAKSVTVR